MSVACSGGLTTLVKWSDLHGLAAQFDAMAAIVTAGQMSPLSADVRLFEAPELMRRVATYEWFYNVATVTDPCDPAQILRENLSLGLYHATLSPAEQWALDHDRLHFIGANPDGDLLHSAGSSANAPCFCCVVGGIVQSGDDLRIVAPIADGSCINPIDFSAPCLVTDSGLRHGVLNTAFLGRPSTVLRPGPRQISKEVSDELLVTKELCTGSAQLVTYAYTWTSARGYVLGRISIPLEGYLGWNIAASDFTAITNKIKLLLSNYCGAQAGKFKVLGSTTAYLKEFCAVSWATLLWNVPNTLPGCIQEATLPWGANTCGATSDCGPPMVYCNTLKHLEAIIAKCSDLITKPGVGCRPCCDNPPQPTLQGATASSEVIRYFAVRDGPLFYTKFQSKRITTTTSFGKNCGGGVSHSVQDYTYMESLQVDMVLRLPIVSGYRQIYYSRGSAVYSDGSGENGSYKSDNTTEGGVSGPFPSLGVSSLNQTYPITGICVSSSYPPVPPSTIKIGTEIVKVYQIVTGAGSFRSGDVVAAVSAPSPGSFSSGGASSHRSTAISDGQVVVQASRGRYKWLLPDTRGYTAWKFSWFISVKGVETALSISHIGAAAESGVYELPFLDEDFSCSGPYGLQVFCGPQTPTAPTVVHSPAVVKAKQSTPFAHSVGGNNLPTSFSASGLPAGLSIHTDTGVISGTPEVSGEFVVEVTVSNEAGSVSSPITIDTSVAYAPSSPVISVEPSNQLVAEGGSAIFAVTVEGFELSFQWYLGSSPISGANSDSLVLTDVSLSQHGNAYSVEVTNPQGTVRSGFAILSVSEGPSVSGPLDRTVLEGSDTTFTATVTDGTGPFSFQWYKNGVEIPGATAASYTIFGVVYNVDPLLSDEGVYFVLVTSDSGAAVAEDGARLSIHTVPVITTQPVGGTYLVGDSLSLSVVATGLPTISYQWFKDSVALSGATAATLNLSPLTVAKSGYYYVRVTTSAGFVDSTEVVVVVQEAPVITAHPVNRTVFPGSTALFGVTARGTPAPTYQWYKDTVALTDGGHYSGATSNLLTVSPAEEADEGVYYCEVTNLLATATSTSATLTVTEAPIFITEPEDTELAYGANFTLATTVTGTAPITYQWFKDGTPISGATASSYDLVAVSYLDRGVYQCVATNTTGTGETLGALIDVRDPDIVTQPVDQTLTEGGYVALFVIANGTAPLEYHWFKGGVSTGVTTATLEFTAVAAEDAGTYYCTVGGPGGLVTSDSATLGVNTLPEFTLDPVGALITPGGSCTLTATAVGIPAPTYQWYKNGSTITGATASSYALTAVTHAAAGDYTVRATNSVGSTDSAVATIAVGFAPIITGVDPAAVTKNPGESVTFSLTLTADPDDALTYQWYKNGVAISGANAATYELADLVEADQATYTCDVTNIYGTATSDGMVLTMYDLPVITGSPVSVDVALHAATSFTVTAVGRPTLTYQWYKNGVELSGSTAATLSFADVLFADAATYFCRVTNSFGSADSAEVTLSVHDVIPAWSSPGSIQAVDEGESFSYDPSPNALNFPTSFSLPFADPLPAGMSFSTLDGSVSGTPDGGSHGYFQIRIMATNTAGDSTTVFTLELTVSAVVPTWSLATDAATGYEGTPFTYTVTAQNFPDSYSLVSGVLPDGLSFNPATGEITGTPAGFSHGVAVLVFDATNTAGTSVTTFELTLEILAVIPLWAVPNDSVGGNQGDAFSYDLAAQSVNSPTEYTLVTGTLPDAVSLDLGSGLLSGLLSGASAGVYVLTFQASNSAGVSSLNFELTITVSSVTPTWTVGSDGVEVEQGGVVEFDFSALAENFPTGYAISGALPDGLVFDTGTGAISGTLSPAVLGAFGYTVTASNAAGTSTGFSFSLDVVAIVPTWTAPDATDTASEGVAYAYSLADYAEHFPTGYSITSGGLPAGLTLDEGTGEITGAPAGYTAGVFTITVSSSNTAGTSATAFTFELTVAAVVPTWTETVATADFDQGVYGTFDAGALTEGFPTGYNYTGTLPAGLSFDADNGVIYGTPTTVGDTLITLSAVNPAGTSVASLDLTISVQAVIPVWSVSGDSDSLPVNAAWSYDLATVVDNFPTAFVITSGTLPSGVSMDTETGEVGGTPDVCAEGFYEITVEASNTAGSSVTEFTLSLTVTAIVPSWSIFSDAVNGTVGVPFSYDFAPLATNCATSFSGAGGTLPAGVSMAASGELSGTPDPGTVGSYTYYVQASNGAGSSTTAFTLDIQIAP